MYHVFWSVHGRHNWFPLSSKYVPCSQIVRIHMLAGPCWSSPCCEKVSTLLVHRALQRPPEPVNMLDTVLFVTGGFNNWVTLANEFSCTVFLMCSVKIKILCSFNQIWNGQMPICVWGGRRNKQKKDQAWSKFYTNLKYAPPDTLRHVICYLVSSHILRCDHCSGIKRKITFVEWVMSSLKCIF